MVARAGRSATLAAALAMGEIGGVRALSMLLLAAAFAQAPLQCPSSTPPSERTYETPAQALYGLAQQFKAKGNEDSWRTTLEYLVARYPNSRYAGMARTDLAAAKGGAATGAAAKGGAATGAAAKGGAATGAAAKGGAAKGAAAKGGAGASGG